VKLDLLKYPDQRLSEVSAPVTRFDEELHCLLEDLAETVEAERGIGLAAPQVGRAVRVLVIDLGSQEGEEKGLREIINPRLSRGEGKIVFEEGCLSVPGVTAEVTRKARITVIYQDRSGKARKLDARGLLAVAIQHETDHLDGKLFLDRLPIVRRTLVKRRLARRAVTL